MSDNSHPLLTTPANAVVPTLLVLAISGLSYLAMSGTLESRRPKIVDESHQPPAPVGAHGFSTNFARLWQDPLSEVKASDTQNAQPASPDAVAEQISLRVASLRRNNPKNRVLCMPVLVPGGPYVELREQRRRTRYALLSALGDAGFSLVYPERMSYIELPLCVQTGPPSSQRLIPKMVVPIKVYYRMPIDPSPHDATDKTRPQLPKYAAVVVLWINESQLGLHPLSSVSQIVEQVFGRVDPIKSNPSAEIEGTDEKGQSDDCKETENQQPIDIAIIGPSSSDALLAMARDDKDWDKRRAESRCCNAPLAIRYLQAMPRLLSQMGSRLGVAPPSEDYHCHRLRCQSGKPQYFRSGRFEKAWLFSPRASIYREALSNRGRDDQRALNKFMTNSRERSGLQVVRTIGNDRSLVGAIRDELKLRDAWPQPPHPWVPSWLPPYLHSRLPSWFPLATEEHVVLITERDTLYGQGFRKTFEEVVSPTPDKDNNKAQKAADENLAQRLHHFTYLRGADGQYPLSDKREEQLQRTATSTDDQSGPDMGTELPHGSGQFDYIRRLAQEISDLRKQLQSENGDIKAIGVVGTDLFDKLLILRALRPQFPTVRFFTTDLDARLAHRDELPYTRNLLVASHFALEVDQQTFNRTVLPFRDSYQTAAYFSVRLAVDDDGQDWKGLLKIRCDPWGLRNSGPCRDRLKPLMFEIGRNGPYQLTRQLGLSSPQPTRSNVLTIHPLSPLDSVRWPSWWWLWRVAIVSFVVCLAALVGLQLKQNGGYGPAIAAVTVLLVVFLLAATGYQFHRQQLGANAGAVALGAVMLVPIALMVTLLVLTMVHVADADGAQHDTLSRDQPQGTAEAGVADKTSPAGPATIGAQRRLLDVITLLTLLLAVAVLIILTWDHVRPTGQPVEFSAAISVWPSTLIRLGAIVLAVVFVGRAFRKLTENQLAIEENYGVARHHRPALSLKLIFGDWRRGQLWRQPRADGREPDSLCQEYFDYERSDARLSRISLWTIVLFFFLLVVFHSTEYPALSYRGDVSQFMATLVLYLASILTIFAILLTLDALVVCQRLVDHLGRSHQDWHAVPGCRRYDAESHDRGWKRPSPSPADAAGTLFLAPQSHPRPKADALSELLTVRLVGDRTRVVSGLLYLPFVLISVMLLARHPLVDSSYLPPAVVVIIAAILIALLAAATYLRRSAAKMRSRVLERLQQQTSRSLARSEGAGEKEQLEIIREDVLAEGRGAFKPLSDDPLLGALAVPTVTATTLLFLERYLMS